MKKIKLQLHNIQEIDKNKNIFIKQNALIRPDGTFYLVKGYTGFNPYQQIESSSLWIGRKEIGPDFVEKYKSFLTHLEENNIEEYKKYLKKLRNVSRIMNATTLYDKRSILVHYYGYTLFCRKELIHSFDDRDAFLDESLVPKSSLHGREATPKQIGTLKELFNLNEEQNVSRYNGCEEIKDKEEMLKLVMKNKNKSESWHC